MNQIKEQLDALTNGDPKKLMTYGILLGVAVLFFIYVMLTSNKPRGVPNAAAPPEAGAPAAGAPPPAPGAEGASVSASSVIPPHVEAEIQAFMALPEDQKKRYLSPSASTEGNVISDYGSPLRVGVKPDPFRPEKGKGSEVIVAGRPSLIPQLVEDVEAAKAQGIEVPEVLTYKIPSTLTESVAVSDPGLVTSLPPPPGLPSLPGSDSGEMPMVPVREEIPKPQPLPYRVAGMVTGEDPVAIVTDGSGKSIFARVGTQLEPGAEVVSIGKESIKVRTANGVEEIFLKSGMGGGAEGGEGKGIGAKPPTEGGGDNSAPFPSGGGPL